MRAHLSSQLTETQRKRSLEHRMHFVHGFFALCVLVIGARLMELQLIRGAEYHALAQTQHFDGVTLPARRGEILSRNSKTGETSILATNTTLDLVYVDPYVTDDPAFVAQTLADILITKQFDDLCRNGSPDCPREMIEFYAAAYDPMVQIGRLGTGQILEPIASTDTFGNVSGDELATFDEVKQRFAQTILDRISEKKVRFVPLTYSANKEQMSTVEELAVPGITVNRDSKLIYADPETIDQSRLGNIARRLAEPLKTDPDQLQRLLRSRTLRYVPVMRKVPPELSLTIRDLQVKADNDAINRRRAAATREEAERITSPLRSIALIPEHWRFYPDGTVGSHVVGFMNDIQEPQYGIESTQNPQLRGQEGRISSVSDPTGGQILTNQQTIVDAKDGDAVVLTIDRFVQQYVETLLNAAVKEYEAESAQAIVIEPETGRIIAMANAPLFDSNQYGNVYEKDPLYLDAFQQKQLVVELYHPETNDFIVKAYLDGIFTASGRTVLLQETREQIEQIEELYDLRDIARYYLYIGENSRREIFPTDRPDIWLKFDNNLGVGAYLNRNIHEIYEPGSVMKAITMAIAIDQGEVEALDRYYDEGPLKIDEYTIRNALHSYYGDVNMVNCMEFSINTCMTFVSGKLGPKLFHRMLTRFGFGRITGIELEDELPGEILPWRNWSSALLATASFGQGVSATPLQMVTAFAALANEGKLMKPMIIDQVIHSDGTSQYTKPTMVDQVVTAQTAEVMTAMLVSSVNNGFANVARIPGYRIAGKTGTSQIAGPGGKYESGTGSTITTFAGYAPVDDPRFVILVKFDRPKRDIYGSQTAGPVFRDITAFLLRYYGIPPDVE